MKIHKVDQGSPEWLRIRAGIPCSSEFHRIVTPTGKPSAQAEGYMFSLLAERITGRPLIENMSWAMDRGSALEHKAVEYFEFVNDCHTEPAGFFTDDEERWGSSPDRTVADDALLEIKCPTINRHMMNLLNEGSAVKEYKIQVQGQLWITERQRTWLMSYHPSLPMAIFPIERDEDFIAILAEEVREFSERLEALATAALERGYFRLNSIRQPKSLESQLTDSLLLKEGEV